MTELPVKVPQSGLILSPSPEAGMALAQRLAQAAVCSADVPPCGLCRNCRKAMKGTHPDIITVTKGVDDKGNPRRELQVEVIRDLVLDARVLPNEAARKVYILRDAGEMNDTSQNALLKLLEEPPEFVCLLLCARKAGLLLDTIRSRCRIYSLNQEDEAPDDAEEDRQARQWLDLAQANDAWGLLRLSEELGSLDNARATAFFDRAQSLLARQLCDTAPAVGLSRPRMARLLALCGRCREALSFNVAVRHVMGLLAVQTPDTDETR